ncbi:hypothetical protein DFQ28_002181 [Apophysomyces sp. BC1034]|nr:hypothetical protein DFQ30_003061 [Apophysomyces sp. BC1015]KAG0165266.1 hypothetical protein DFQ29_001686 [Apophysomyces sp. BC1021]KAG0182141.1 hypothetical protein DFQ28_002181 [Apophysomyces sp. BC1034]
MRLSLFALCASVLLAVTVHAAPVEQHHNVVVETATENPVIRTDSGKDALSQATRAQEQQVAEQESYISGGVKSIAKPVLAALQPTAQGVDAGLEQGAGNLNAGVQNAGAALNQAANGVADIAANTVAGAGQTVGQAPGAVEQTVHAIDTNNGVIGSVDRAVFGGSN